MPLILPVPCSQLRHPPSLSLFPPITSSASSSRPKPSCRTRTLPARDQVIDFGMHKGRMLGSLPSSYLRWVSANLRARDFERWARLADEVLRDPVYRDRLEWESADRVLSGDGLRASDPSSSAVSDLLEISGRFGWDNDDKAGWARIDFNLLGTSSGGRIPRIPSPSQAENSRATRTGELGELGFPRMGWRTGGERKGGTLLAESKASNVSVPRNGKLRKERRLGIQAQDLELSNRGELEKNHKVGLLSMGHRHIVEEKGKEVVGGGRREERIQRGRIKRQQQMGLMEKDVEAENSDGRNDKLLRDKAALRIGQFLSPFPGREALLEKIRRQGG